MMGICPRLVRSTSGNVETDPGTKSANEGYAGATQSANEGYVGEISYAGEIARRTRTTTPPI